MVDNLMDLTHLPYVHHHVPGGEAMKKTPLTTEEREFSFRVLRQGKAPWNPYFDGIFGKDAAFEGVADFDIPSDFYGPEFIKTSLPVITALEGRDDVPKELGTLFILHGITPETETTTHYFGFSTRNFRLGEKELDDFQLAGDLKIRGQDVEAIDAVEARLDEAVERQRELLAIADRPASLVRRKIKTMLEEEQQHQTLK
jgi:vanillate O-demethylase monooxygenase subunit